MLDADMDHADPPPGAPSPDPSSRRRRTLQRLAICLSVVVLVYLLIMAVGMVSTGFKWVSGGKERAEAIFAFASNPFVGLLLGVLATAIVQSSSATTSVVVGLVAGETISVATAVPIIMGANIGTTVTALLVSMGHITRKQEFRRAFAAATVHDLFNWIAVVIFLSAELITRWITGDQGLLEMISGSIAGLVVRGDAPVTEMNIKDYNFIKAITKPVMQLLHHPDEHTGILDPLGRWGGGITYVVISLGLIFGSIVGLGIILRRSLSARAERVFHAAIGRGHLTGITCGTVVTALVQSSSTTTSLVVPMVGSGVLTLRQVFPFLVGANIGTTITALLASLAPAKSPALQQAAFQIAVVHTLFNVSGAVIIYGIPFLRVLPLKGSEWLATLTLKSRSIAIFYVIVTFFLIPLGCLGVSKWLEDPTRQQIEHPHEKQHDGSPAAGRPDRGDH